MSDFLTNVKFAQENTILRKIGEFADDIEIPCYVVGGYVRDRFLCIPSKDIDIVVLGDGPYFALEFTRRHGLSEPSIFKKFGTAQFKIDDIETEIVGARRESYTEESIKPEVIRGTLIDDVLRRDFTINTLLVPLNLSVEQKIIDLTGLGIHDLEHGIIRTPVDPTKTFTDDPTRILRAFRFASKFGFFIHEDTIEGIKANTLRLYKVPVERIRDELLKILTYDEPARYFDLMRELGVLRIVMPGFDMLFYIKQDPKYHYYDVGRHTLDVLKNVERKDVITRLGALFHDYGKIDNYFVDESGNIKTYGHESSILPKIAMRRLKLDNKTIAKVMLIVQMHMRLEISMGIKGIRKFIRDANGVLEELLDVIIADGKSHKQGTRNERFYDLIEKIRTYEIGEITKLQTMKSPLSGHEIIQALNYPSMKTTPNWNRLYGTRIGQLQRLIIDNILAQNIENTKEDARNFILRLPKELLYPK